MDYERDVCTFVTQLCMWCKAYRPVEGSVYLSGLDTYMHEKTDP